MAVRRRKFQHVLRAGVDGTFFTHRQHHRSPPFRGSFPEKPDPAPDEPVVVRHPGQVVLHVRGQFPGHPTQVGLTPRKVLFRVPQTPALILFSGEHRFRSGHVLLRQLRQTLVFLLSHPAIGRRLDGIRAQTRTDRLVTGPTHNAGDGRVPLQQFCFFQDSFLTESFHPGLDERQRELRGS